MLHPCPTPGLPNVTITGPMTANRNDMVVLTCSGSGQGNLTANWTTTAADQSLSVTEESNTVSTLTIAAVEASNGGEYTCEITNENGSANATTVLRVRPYIASHPMDISTLAGMNQNLECSALGFPDPTYRWEKQEGEGVDNATLGSGGGLMMTFFPLNETSNQITFLPVDFSDFGVYRCVASNVAGDATSHEATLTGKLAIDVNQPVRDNSFQWHSVYPIAK